MGYGVFIWLRGIRRRLREQRMAKAIGNCKFEVKLKLGDSAADVVSLYEIYADDAHQAALLTALAGACKGNGESIVSAAQREAVEQHLSAYEINQAACISFASHLPAGWQVHYRPNGDIAEFIDAHGHQVSTHSWADPHALQSDLLADPHDCIVDSDTYQLMAQSGAVADLDRRGVSVYNGNYHHITETTSQISETNSSSDLHFSDYLIVGRAGMSILQNTTQVAKGEKSIQEGGKDVAVDVGVLIARTKAGAVGFALGGPVGAALGYLAATTVGEVLREEWKYGKLMSLLEGVGKDVQAALGSKWSRARLIESIARGCMSYDSLQDEIRAEEKRGKQYENETRIYSSSYTPPTTAGVLCRMRQRQLRQECRWVETAVARALVHIRRLGSSRRSSRGILGEIALASPDMFSPIIPENVDLIEVYKRLSESAPNHPYRLCDSKTSRPIESRDYFAAVCHGQYAALRQGRVERRPPVSRWGVAIVALGGLWFVMETEPTWSKWTAHWWSAAPEPAATPPSDDAEKVAAEAEAARFAAMSSKQHLEVARTALHEGYDRHRRIGGNLELAERHLRAISTVERENKDAQRLLQVIADRRRRTTLRVSRRLSQGNDAGRLASPPAETAPSLNRKHPPVVPTVRPSESHSETVDGAIDPDPL